MPQRCTARTVPRIWPAGFDRFFDRLGEIFRTATGPDELEAQRTELGRLHRLDFIPDWIDELKAKYGLRLLGEP